MYQINLREFALTGNFGPVTIGMNKNQVIQLLGEPDIVIDYHTGSTGVLYGGYEFFFWTDSNLLHSLQNEQGESGNFDGFCFSNVQITVDPWIFTKPASLSEISEYLRINNIVYQIIDFLDRKLIQFESGVILDFNNEVHDYVTGESRHISNYLDYVLIGFRYN